MWTTTVDKHSEPPVPVPGSGARSWGPPPVLIVGAAVATLAAASWAVLATTGQERLAATAICLVLAMIAVGLLRRRLTAGPGGLLVRGVRGTRSIQWSLVRGLTAGSNRRLGAASTTIEVDLHDDDLLIFGRTDLGADPAEVLTVLRQWWLAASRPDAIG